ncbi:MAG: EF-hand domain-containing protein [Pseudomonadota bacterium]
MVASISSSTASQWADKLFTNLDTKKQGYIDADELQAALGKDATSEDATKVLKQFDANGDGQVSKTELSDAINKVVEQLNAQSVQGKGHGEHRGPPPAHGGEKPPPPPPPQGGSGASSATSSDPADTNGDGTVSAEEAQAYATKAETNNPGLALARALKQLSAYVDQQSSGSSVNASA